MWFVICTFEKKEYFITDALKYITYFFEVLPFIFCLINYKDVVKSKDRRVFFIYVAAVALFIIVGVIGRYCFGSSEFFYMVTRVYDVTEYTLLAYFFYLIIRNKYIGKIVIYSIIPFIIYCFYDYLSAKEPGFAFLPLVVECLTLLAVLIYIFYEKMNYLFDTPIYQTSFFWVAVAFIIYFAGSFFLFLYSKNSFHDKAFNIQYIILYSCVTISKDILLCISTFIKDKTEISEGFPIENSPEFFHPFNNQQ